MVGKNVFYRAGIAICVGSMLITGLPASASSRSNAEKDQLAEARALVAEYRELRRTCTGQTGEDRKSCIHELRASNGEYRMAKQQLGLMESADPENIHLVSF